MSSNNCFFKGETRHNSKFSQWGPSNKGVQLGIDGRDVSLLILWEHHVCLGMGSVWSWFSPSSVEPKPTTLSSRHVSSVVWLIDGNGPTQYYWVIWSWIFNLDLVPSPFPILHSCIWISFLMIGCNVLCRSCSSTILQLYLQACTWPKSAPWQLQASDVCLTCTLLWTKALLNI